MGNLPDSPLKLLASLHHPLPPGELTSSCNSRWRDTGSALIGGLTRASSRLGSTARRREIHCGILLDHLPSPCAFHLFKFPNCPVLASIGISVEKLRARPLLPANRACCWAESIQRKAERVRTPASSEGGHAPDKRKRPSRDGTL